MRQSLLALIILASQKILWSNVQRRQRGGMSSATTSLMGQVWPIISWCNGYSRSNPLKVQIPMEFANGWSGTDHSLCDVVRKATQTCRISIRPISIYLSYTLEGSALMDLRQFWIDTFLHKCQRQGNFTRTKYFFWGCKSDKKSHDDIWNRLHHHRDAGKENDAAARVHAAPVTTQLP